MKTQQADGNVHVKPYWQNCRKEFSFNLLEINRINSTELLGNIRYLARFSFQPFFLGNMFTCLLSFSLEISYSFHLFKHFPNIRKSLKGTRSSIFLECLHRNSHPNYCDLHFQFKWNIWVEPDKKDSRDIICFVWFEQNPLPIVLSVPSPPTQAKQNSKTPWPPP